MAKVTEPEKNRMIHDRGYMTSEERSEVWRILAVIAEMNNREMQLDEEEEVDLIELHDQIND